MKKMKSSLLATCIAAPLACGSSPPVTAQDITIPDAPSRIRDTDSNLKISQAAAAGSLAKPQGSTSFGRQNSAAQMETGSVARQSLSNDRNAVLAELGAISPPGRTSSSVASSPRSDSLDFSLTATNASLQGQIGMSPSRSARSTPSAGDTEKTAINLDVFSQSRLVD